MHKLKKFSDKLSSKDNNRPQIKEMLNNIKEDDIIVMSELDRLEQNNKEITSIMNHRYRTKEQHLKSLISIFERYTGR